MNHKSLAEIKETYLPCLIVQNIAIGLINEYATITVQMAKIKLRTNLQHLDGITRNQNITKCEMLNLYTTKLLLIINKRFSGNTNPRNTNLGCIITWPTIADLVFPAGITVRPVLQAVKPILESGHTSLMSRLDQSV